MTWLTGEPTLDDALSDPVVHAMMARDRVDAESLRGFLHDMRRAHDMAEAEGSTAVRVTMGDPLPRLRPPAGEG